MRTARSAIVMLAMLTTGGWSQGRPPLVPTTVTRFGVTASDLDKTPAGTATCAEPSRAAWFRADALLCTSGKTTYDPCFTTAREDVVLCATDPRSPAGRILMKLGTGAPAPSATVRAGHRAWFFELTDGSTCRPLTAAGREVEGLIELYECKFGTDGPADAVLGDLDSSAPIWTISKVQINKKMDPPTIKWNNSVAVRAVWQ